ncbi:HAMP domain-containing protein [Bailinhaonella thermotolerans]|uniref:histidine kinase n=2 Tax=Bailinhaonella thermotolerans TaxID=1070861 RepID=A0A3A4AUF9_9ACTN|nr:HAMP domain-containing protein [Bailinhaonella thermotolerans]
MLAVTLGVGGVIFIATLSRLLLNSIDDATRQRAEYVVTLLESGQLPDPLPVTGGSTLQLVELAPTGGNGRIVSASPLGDRLVPLVPYARIPSATEPRFLDGRPYGLPGPMRVVVVSAGEGRYVIAATPFAETRFSIDTTVKAAFFGLPLLLLLLAAMTWLIVGSALRPISALRRGATAITARQRYRRLPVPESRDEVHSLAVTLNDMLARLEDADARQRALVSDAAHELRSPLASIRTQLEVALDYPDRTDWPDTARGVLEDTLRLSRLAEDLLALARLDERRGAVRQERLDLAALALGVAERYGEAPVAVTASAGEGGGVPVMGEPGDLTRVLVNLIDNAVRHAESAVSVSVGDERGGWAVLTVTDDGPGIPEADRERVFARFTRLDTARSRDAGGAGLGLAIVRETVRAHGGDVHLEDAGPGLRAVVRLPRAGDVTFGAAIPS